LKKFNFLSLTLLLFACLPGFSQLKRCVTEERMQEIFRTDPQAKTRYEQTRRMLDLKVSEYMSNHQSRLLRTQAIINIPVVVHILTNNPSLVTDATVQSQIDTLNWYYGNAASGDSLRTYSSFRTSYGRSQIRFCLAQRTPLGLGTNGIERQNSSTIYSAGGVHPHTEMPAWNSQNYLNIWVVQFGGGVLGYSYKPGMWPVGSQNIGLVVDYRAFGSGPSYLYPEYNKGRTSVHELGHYFNLDHTWGANNSGNPTCSLDDGCFDTPRTEGPFFGCPDPITGIPVLNSCSPMAPGIMWQNHMDYADDACMTIFTNQQVIRMEAAMNNSSDRNTLISSNGCQPLVITPHDAGITAILNPGVGSISCSSSVTPSVTLRNYGTANLNSVNIVVTVNGVAQPPEPWTGSLAPGTSVNLPLASISLNMGNNTILVTTSSPNGEVDGDPTNNVSITSTNYVTTGALPVSENFEAASFPPSGWFVINPNGDFTWQRSNVGKASSGSMWINNFDIDGTNNRDDFRSIPVSTTGVGAMTISFDLANKSYGTSGMFWDTLSVLVSGDCGASYETVYKKWGPNLATAGPSSTIYTTPASSDWRPEVITVSGPVLAGGQVSVVFRNTSRFGNNIFIDNINIQKQANRDIRILSINSPGNSLCTPQVTPQVTVENTGAETVSSFRVGYRIDDGTIINQTFTQTLAPGETASVNLAGSTTVSGSRNITAFVADPVSASGTGDIQPNNDTVSKSFSVVALTNPPLTEGFERSFPPAGWVVNNPNANFTWMRKAPGRNSNYAAFIDNFNNQGNNETDDLRTPYINVAGADSLILNFDLAHKNYPQTLNSDTLSVLVSTDCGNTYTTVYKKWAATLATAGTSLEDFALAGTNDWRNERIALGSAFTGNGSVQVVLRNTNRFGNNIFIDNINLATVYQRDVRLVNVPQPASILCEGNTTPSVTLKNMGLETITGVRISYSINNGPLQTTTLTGLNLVRDAQAQVNLNATTVNGLGSHSIRVYAWDPVSASGTGDQYLYNDTIVKAFNMAGSMNAPLSEDFNSGNFPPLNWSLVNPDAAISWRDYSVGNTNPGSAFVNTFNYSLTGERDDLVTPNINFQGVDSVTLSFDLSAATFSNPGSTDVPLDTLEVLVSKDCGNSFTTVYKKWGEELQTLGDPNNGQSSEYFPVGASQWRKETIDLTSQGVQGPVMVFFRTTNNFENNIFIDNVNLKTRILPERIKQQGYLVLPNPFRNSFSVWHVQVPAGLRYIHVYNAVGQLVWTKTFQGNATKMEPVNLAGKAAGSYIVKLGYEDSSLDVSERVIKY
jgi:hypothetical protein